MSKRSVFAWLILALLFVAGAALYLAPRSLTGVPGRATLDFSPSSVGEVTITGPAWSREYHFTKVDGQWRLRMPAPGQEPQEAPAWPVEAQRLDAMMALLRDRIEPAPDASPAEPPASAIRVRLWAGNGPHQIQLEPLGPGGKARVWVNGPSSLPQPAFVSREVRDLFDERAIRTWRTPVALPDAQLGASRITLQSGNQRVRLGQVQSRWGVVDPPLGPADGAFLATTLRTLAGLPIAAFEDDISPEDPQLAIDTPTAAIRLERDLRRADGDQSRAGVVVSELLLGPLADVGGTHSLGVASAWLERPGDPQTPLWGPLVVRIPADQLRPLKADPLAYVSPLALRAPAVEVQSVSITPPDVGAVRRYVRASGVWNLGEDRASVADEKALQALLILLTETPAAAVLKSLPELPAPLALLEVSALDAPSPRRFTLRVLQPGGVILAPALAIDDGSGLHRLHDLARIQPLVDWLTPR